MAKEKKDKKGRLQGAWVAEKDGKKVELTITKDMFTFIIDGNDKYIGTFKADASKDPKQLDLTVKDGNKYVGMTALCIYEIKDDMLKWCANEPGKDTRPQAFPENEGQGEHLYLIFKRAK